MPGVITRIIAQIPQRQSGAGGNGATSAIGGLSEPRVNQLIAAAFASYKLNLFKTPNNVTGTRAYNTEYTNSNLFPIFVLIRGGTNSTGLIVDGVNITSSFVAGNICSAIIPSGSTYKFGTATGTVNSWFEFTEGV